MKRFKPNPDILILLGIIFSVFYMLCLSVIKGSNAQVQGIPFNSTLKLSNTVQQKIRLIYTSEIGVRERSSNAGPAIEKYLSYVGLPKGNPWCAAFVCWVFGQVGVDNPRTGWSPALFPDNKVIWRKKENLYKEPGIRNQESRLIQKIPNTPFQSLKTPGNTLSTDKREELIPRSGDVFGLYFPDKKRIAHVGFVDQWLGDWLITVEGNTNDPGSREGDGVYRKRRQVGSLDRVARYGE